MVIIDIVAFVMLLLVYGILAGFVVSAYVPLVLSLASFVALLYLTWITSRRIVSIVGAVVVLVVYGILTVMGAVSSEKDNHFFIYVILFTVVKYWPFFTVNLE